MTSHFSRDAAFQLHAAAAATARERQGRGYEEGNDASGVAASGSGPTSTSSLVSSTHTTTTERYPLPPEGQPPSALSSSGSSSGSSSSSSSNSSNSSSDGSSHHTVSGIVGGPGTRDVQYWEAGWYIWMTKNAWAVQERVEMMSLDLEKQTRWMRVKEAERREWAAVQARGMGDEEMQNGEGEGQGQQQQHQGQGQGQGEEGFEFGSEGEQDKTHPYLVASYVPFPLPLHHS